jgi:hypothetical protein
MLEEARGRVVDPVGEQPERSGDEDDAGDDQGVGRALEDAVAESAP